MINLNFNSEDECKKYLKTLLENTDYVCLSDVKDQLENYQELVFYRQSIRACFLLPTVFVSIPEEPKPIWK